MSQLSVSYKAGRYYVSVTAEIEETSRYNNDSSLQLLRHNKIT